MLKSGLYLSFFRQTSARLSGHAKNMAPYGNLSILRDQTDGKAGTSEPGRASGQPPPWPHIYARVDSVY